MMLELLKRYGLGAIGLAVAAYVLMQWRETRDELEQERAKHKAREEQLQELVRVLQQDASRRVVVQVEQAKASGAEVRARPATVPEARASEARGVAWDRQLEEALQRGRHAGAR